jgi:hypothetical protein
VEDTSGAGGGEAGHIQIVNLSDQEQSLRGTTAGPNEFDATTLGWPAGTLPGKALPIPAAGQLSVAAVSGEVQVQNAAGQAAQKAEIQRTLGADGQVSTGSSGRTLLTSPDGSLILVSPNSRVRVGEPAGGAGSRNPSLYLQAGKVACAVRPTGKEQGDFSVKTPAAVVRAMGTVFTVSHDAGRNTTTVAVQKGEVSVTPTRAGAAPFFLVAGEESSIQGPETVTTGTGGTVTGVPSTTAPSISGPTTSMAQGASSLHRLFAAESVWLARLGGYADTGRNSTDEAHHLHWATRQSDQRLCEALIEKFLTQFDRQAARGQQSGQQFYAAASARLARYGVDLGDAGSNLKDQEPHLRWARGQTTAKLREAIREKLSALLKGVQQEQPRR